LRATSQDPLGECAVHTHRVPDEEREALVVLLNLNDVSVRKTLATPGTLPGLRAGYGGCVDVLTRRVPALEILTFAALATTAENYLVDAGGVVLARDEPDTVLEGNLVGVLGVEVAASLNSGGGWWRWLR
jgi:hypothetical protein